jgi:hypothetical protein
VALVEPGEAGAVATWAKGTKGGKTEDWEVVRPYDALGHKRRLHAKFVYVGTLRAGHASNGWLYLGSGNLSHRGILTHGGMAEGNVETGVVFAVDERLDADAIKRWLFWSHKAKTVGDDEWAIGQVGDAPDTQPILEAPPILSATIETAPSRHLRLLWRDDISDKSRVQISWLGRDWFDVKKSGKVALQNDETPAALTVSESGHEWVVPVVDSTGRVGWQPRLYENFAEALDALLDFPIRPTEDMDEDEESEIVEGNTKDTIMGQAQTQQAKGYALHEAAELIERVAALQSALPEGMFNDWLDHLDRMFRASFPKDVIETWKKHRLNIFTHLKNKELCPAKWKDDQHRRYTELLDSLSTVWGLQ